MAMACGHGGHGADSSDMVKKSWSSHQHMSGWGLTYPSEKYESQVG
jgi:hypothetical protein